jgi:hypothetical protein
MRRPLVFAFLLFASVSGYAFAAKPCEDLKGEIAKTLDAKGVKAYTLDIVAKDKEVEGKVVGSCEGGTKKIVYSREQGEAKKPAAEAEKK